MSLEAEIGRLAESEPQISSPAMPAAEMLIQSAVASPTKSERLRQSAPRDEDDHDDVELLVRDLAFSMSLY